LQTADILKKYERRLASGMGRSYDLRPQNIVLWQEIDQTLCRVLIKFNMRPERVLIVGAGYGAEVYQLLRIGFTPKSIFCVDMLQERIDSLITNCPPLGGTYIGAYKAGVFAENFDLILCCTVLSSISDDIDRNYLIANMAQSLNSDGALLVYDIAFNNPRNKDVRRVNFLELTQTSGLYLRYSKKIAILPRLARRMAGLPLWLTSVIRLLGIFRTHRVSVLFKRADYLQR
jgi:SAM-dependent methyltransferase